MWLLFDSENSRFPLHPGDAIWTEHACRVTEDKWGHWFQQAVRLPTGHLLVRQNFPHAA